MGFPRKGESVDLTLRSFDPIVARISAISHVLSAEMEPNSSQIWKEAFADDHIVDNSDRTGSNDNVDGQTEESCDVIIGVDVDSQ